MNEAGHLTEQYSYDAHGTLQVRACASTEVCEGAGPCALTTTCGAAVKPGSGEHAGTHGNTLLYAGTHRDPVTGHYRMGARWYDPTLRTFLSRDPAGYAFSFDEWAYTVGDPWNFVDRTGWGPESCLNARNLERCARRVYKQEEREHRRLEKYVERQERNGRAPNLDDLKSVDHRITRTGRVRWRGIYDWEIPELQRMYGKSVDFSVVRLYERLPFPLSLVSPAGMNFAKNKLYIAPDIAYVDSDISRGLDFGDPGAVDLIFHEFGHIWQGQNGLDVVKERLLGWIENAIRLLGEGFRRPPPGRYWNWRAPLREDVRAISDTDRMSMEESPEAIGELARAVFGFENADVREQLAGIDREALLNEIMGCRNCFE